MILFANFDYYIGVVIIEMLPRKYVYTRQKKINVNYLQNWRVEEVPKFIPKSILQTHLIETILSLFTCKGYALKSLTETLKPKASEMRKDTNRWKGCKLANNRLESVSVCDGR